MWCFQYFLNLNLFYLIVVNFLKISFIWTFRTSGTWKFLITEFHLTQVTFCIFVYVLKNLRVFKNYFSNKYGNRFLGILPTIGKYLSIVKFSIIKFVLWFEIPSVRLAHFSISFSQARRVLSERKLVMPILRGVK